MSALLVRWNVSQPMPGFARISSVSSGTIVTTPFRSWPVAKEVERAVSAARQGYAAMSEMPAYRRSEILAHTADCILRDKEEIAAIIAREAGKSWKFALSEAERSAETFRFAALEAKVKELR